MSNPFLNIADDLGPFAQSSQPAPALPSKPDVAEFFQSAVTPVENRRTCNKCGGSGVWRSWSGYRGGTCFACKGTGSVKVFKTSEAERAKARKQRVERKQRAASDWMDRHPTMVEWLKAHAERFDFAASMLDAVERYGELTPNQFGAVVRCMARDTERAAQRVEREARAPVADSSKIEQSFAVARERGLKRPIVRLGEFKFSPAPETGKNPGAVYVKAKDGAYLGKMLNGRFVASRECSSERANEIISAAADPLAAAVAYGKRFGQCAICGRELTKGESIDRGIGPICADKFGW